MEGGVNPGELSGVAFAAHVAQNPVGS
jgi:hypothetical protein